MRGIAVLAFLALLAAGCSSAPPPAAPPAEPATDGDDPTPAFEMRECTGQFAVFVVDDQAVQAQMPPRYRPLRVQGVAGALVDVEVAVCDIAIGADVETGIATAAVSTKVGQTTDYRLEWAVPAAKAPRFTAWLQEHGWPVVDAEVQVQPGLVTVRGPAVDYTLADAAGPAGALLSASVEGGIPHLVHDPGTGEVRLDHNRTVRSVEGGSAAQLVATAGLLSRLVPGGQAMTATSAFDFVGVQYGSVFTEGEDTAQPVRD